MNDKERMIAYNRTSNTLSYTIEVQRQARVLTKDPDKEERLAKQLCKKCYYLGSLMMNHFEKKACEGCGADIMVDSLLKGLYCQKCAEERELCKRCGADIELRLTRFYRK